MDEYQALSHTTPVLRRCHVPASARITAFVCAADKPSNQASAFADTWSAGSCRAPLLRSVRTLSFPLRGAVLGIVVIMLPRRWQIAEAARHGLAPVELHQRRGQDAPPAAALRPLEGIPLGPLVLRILVGGLKPLPRLLQSCAHVRRTLADLHAMLRQQPDRPDRHIAQQPLVMMIQNSTASAANAATMPETREAFQPPLVLART